MSNVFIIDNTSGTESFAVQPGTLDGPGGTARHSDFRLYGLGIGDWGEGVDENFYRLLETSACPEKGSSPGTPQDETDLGAGKGITNPINGQLWFNSTTGALFIFDGALGASGEWKTAGGLAFGNASQPGSPHLGDLWYDDNVPQLNIWNGTIWESVASRYLELDGGTMSGDIDFSNTYHNINMIDPTNPQDAATMNYVDGEIDTILTGGALDGQYVRIVGDTMTGNLTIARSGISSVTLNATGADSTFRLETNSIRRGSLVAVNGSNDIQMQAYETDGITTNGELNIGGPDGAGVASFTGVDSVSIPLVPTLGEHATSKQYVDNIINSSIIGKNSLINGNLDVWQRGTSMVQSSATAKYLADRWLINTSGMTSGSLTTTRQSFTVGQTDVPNEPTYYIRLSGSSYTAVDGGIGFQQHIESVRKHAGKTITVSFYAKASSALTIGVNTIQDFGTGGSAITHNTGGGTQLAITSTWAKYTATITVPSISGKTIGASQDDALILQTVLTSVGTSATSHGWTAIPNLGSEFVDIAQIQVEEGSVATKFDQRPAQIELDLCLRYYEKSYELEVVPGSVTGLHDGCVLEEIHVSVTAHNLLAYYTVVKRRTASIILYSPVTGTNYRVYTVGNSSDRSYETIHRNNEYGWGVVSFWATQTGSGTGVWLYCHYTADAELY